MLNLEKIGQKICMLRKEKDMNQNELADKLFVTHQAVSKWENGRSIPSIEVMYALTKLFNVSIDFLLDDTEIKEDDFDTLLRIYPRESVIRKFVDGSDPKEKIKQILYLLNEEERLFVLEQIRLGYLNIPIENYWHMLSKKERMRILSNVRHRMWDIDLSTVRYQMTVDEQKLIRNSKIGGRIL